MKNIFFLFWVLTLCFACNSDDDVTPTQQQEIDALENQLNEIIATAESVACEDASLWGVTGVGQKACGGPVGYLAYPTTIDVAAFLERLETHRQAEDEFNRRWGITSTCDVTPMPTAVVCEDGVAVLMY